MAGPRSIEIHILGRAYKVACSREEETALIAAADFLDEKMREIRENSKVIGAERIKVRAQTSRRRSSACGSATRASEHRSKA